MFGNRSFYSRGFTLIEVLISMVILAIGLLGLASLQAISLRDNQDAYYYQQATLLAYEMQDRIRANGVYWSVNSSVTAATTASCTCSGTSCSGCTAAQMAATDYQYWKDSVTNVFPAPTSGNMVEIKLSSAVMKSGCQGTYTSSLCLITRWARTNSTTSSTASKLSDTATYYLEVTP